MFQPLGKHWSTTLSILHTVLLAHLLSPFSPTLKHLAWAAPAGGDPLVLPPNGEIPMDASFVLPLTGAIVPPPDAAKIPGNAQFDTETFMDVDPSFLGEPMKLVASGPGTAGADTDRACTKDEKVLIEEGIRQTVVLARAALASIGRQKDLDEVDRFRRWFGNADIEIVKKVFQNMVDFAGLKPQAREDVFEIVCPSDAKCRSKFGESYIPLAQAGPQEVTLYAAVSMNTNHMFLCPNVFKAQTIIRQEDLPFLDLQYVSGASIGPTPSCTNSHIHSK
ncbi:hypothetical protein DFH27DRAFT_280504 [Peziza echinospora]|nr:hypothetical protein DFH27DRAFT_280504 [Peziza echinospora]